MEISVKDTVLINNITLNRVTAVEIEDNKVKFGMGECDCKDIKEMLVDEKCIIKNGKLKIGCKNCDECPMCKEISFEIHISSHTLKREQGFYCGYNKVYSEEIDKLKRSRIRSKSEIELRKSYELIEEKFKYRRQGYITDETIKECINDIKQCMIPCEEGHAINEYGHRRIELERIRIYKNDYGYVVYHYGKMGDDGWSSKIYVHKKCDAKRLVSELRRVASKHRCKFTNEL